MKPTHLPRPPHSSAARRCLCAFALLLAAGCATSSPDPGSDLDSTCFALGALVEYIGYRVDDSPDRIDTFGAGRRARAIVFARHLERAAAREGLDPDIVVRAGAGGCTIVSSGPMKAWLVSRFPVPPPVPDVPPGAPPGEPPDPPPGAPAFEFRYASREMLPDRRAETSWLAGAYLRFAVGDSLVFANAGHKARIAAALLRERGSRKVEVRQTPRGHYPTVFTVTYEPSPEIESLFAAVDREVEEVRRGTGTPDS